MTVSEDFAVPGWDDYIGQPKVKEQLAIKIDASLVLGVEPDHILLAGPPGYGKTNLARLIAQRLRQPFRAFTMPMKEKDFVYFCNDWTGGVLLLDEIHSASKAFLELLMQAAYDGEIQLSSGRTVITDHITFVIATTEEDKLPEPLLERFKIQPVFDLYSDDEMRQILLGMARKIDVQLEDDLALGLARATGGRPRIAEGLVTSARDLTAIGREVTVDSVLSLTGVDRDGLSAKHQHYLTTLHELGDEAGLSRLCTMMRMRPVVVENLERLLVTRGYIRFEPKGRTLTPAGAAKLPGRKKLSFTERQTAA